LKKSCRKEDIIARWNNNVFCILLASTTREQCADICKRIRKNGNILEKKKDFSSKISDKEKINISISLGFAVKETSKQDINQALKKAGKNIF